MTMWHTADQPCLQERATFAVCAVRTQHTVAVSPEVVRDREHNDGDSQSSCRIGGLSRLLDNSLSLSAHDEPSGPSCQKDASTLSFSWFDACWTCIGKNVRLTRDVLAVAKQQPRRRRGDTKRRGMLKCQSIRQCSCTYSSIGCSRSHLPLGCLYSSQALLAMLSGLKFFASGDTTPPTLSSATCTSSPYLSCNDSTRARWADFTMDSDTRSYTGSFHSCVVDVTKKDGARSSALTCCSLGMAHNAVSYNARFVSCAMSVLVHIAPAPRRDSPGNPARWH